MGNARIRLLSALLVIVLVAAGVPRTAHAQDDTCLIKGGFWDPDTGICTIRSRVEISMNYPLWVAQYPALEVVVDEFFQSLRMAFLSYTDYPLPFPEAPPYTMYVYHEQFQFSPEIVSLKFTIDEYTGGAHGMVYFKTITFDVAQGRELTFDDLFQEEFNPLWTIAPLVQESIAAQLGEFADVDWIAEGTGENPDNYQNFVVTPTELIFYFPPYQVAAYAAGPITVSLPLTSLVAILAPPFFEAAN